MKYRHLFFDLDHTLWDFDANARSTLLHLHTELNLEQRGVDDFELFHRKYLAHNERLWARYRNGFIKQEELRTKRMWLTLLDFRIADEALTRRMSDLFLEMLPSRTLLFPQTKEVLEYLSGKGYHLHLITNGFEKVQHGKIRNAGINQFFRNVVTSESSNSLKPKKEIFLFALQKAGATASESLMIGDCLDADIGGAMAVGMDQVHANYKSLEQKVRPTYTITALEELKTIL